MKILFSIISLLLISNIQASDKAVNKSDAKLFMSNYIRAVKKDDFTALHKMSVSKTNHHYAAVKKGLETLYNNEYELSIVPLSKNDTSVNFLKALSGGNCKLIGNPTHEATAKWTSNKEEYYKGHTCHRQVQSSQFITIALSNKNGIIKEHSSCEKESFPQSPKSININEIPDHQKTNIKKWLIKQKSFSVITTYKYIKSKYGYNYPDSKIIIKAVCDEL